MTGDDQRPKYHGKRRNAFVGNIKYYRPPRYSDNNSNKRNEYDDSEESCHFFVYKQQKLSKN